MSNQLLAGYNGDIEYAIKQETFVCEKMHRHMAADRVAEIIRSAALAGRIAALQHSHADGCEAPRPGEHPHCVWCKKLLEATLEMHDA